MNVPLIRVRAIPALIPADGKPAEIRIEGEWLQWRIQGEDWINLTPVSEITGPAGEMGPLTKWRQEGAYLQAAPEGTEDWENIVPISDITGPEGEVNYQGPWEPGTYLATMIVEHGGSLWFANVDVEGEPGVDPGWVLMLPGVTAADGSITPEKLAPETVSYVNSIASDAVPIYETISGMTSIAIVDATDRIYVSGQATVGDGLGGMFIDQDNGTPVVFATAAGAGAGARDWYRAEDVTRPRLKHFERSIPLNVREFGMLGNDNESNLVPETSEFQAAITAAIASNRELILPDTNYLVDGTVGSSSVYNLRMRGLGARPPKIIASQDMVDAPGFQQVLGFQRAATTGGTVTVVPANEIIWPSQKRIRFLDVSQLRPGMLITLTSDQVWYYDGRNQWMKGEVHLISHVDYNNNWIEVFGATWDRYNIPDNENLSVRAFNPEFASISNLEIAAPSPSVPADGNGVSGIRLDRSFKPEISDVYINGLTGPGLTLDRNWYARIDRLFVNETGIQGRAGTYGVASRSSVGNTVTNFHARNCRRAWDDNSASGPNMRSPTRLTKIDGFSVHGGGIDETGERFMPFGDTPSFGIGMHGPCEQMTMLNGYIESVDSGITVRGRSTTIKNVEFAGRMPRGCVSATYGDGLDVSDCRYNRQDYPTKFANFWLQSRADWQANYFIEFGNSGENNDWSYQMPATVRNITASGLRRGFVRFAEGGVKRNLSFDNIDVAATPDEGGMFYFFDARTRDGSDPSSSIEFTRSRIGGISFRALRQGGSGQGRYSLFHPDIRLGVVGSAGDYLKNGDNTYISTMADGQPSTIDGAVPPNRAAVVQLIGRNTATGASDFNYRAHVMIQPDSLDYQAFGDMGNLVEILSDNSMAAQGNVGLYLSGLGSLRITNSTGFEMEFSVTII